jgi:hypothetical protein
MRSLVVVAALVASARAEPMPKGTLGPVFGVMSGTGADAKRLGFGFYQFGMQASWQPTTTEQSLGATLRWSTVFGTLYGGTASQIESPLRTVQMDLTVGIRFRPWKAPSRYLTLRAGGEVLRANEPIPPQMERSFVGGVVSAGFDQYVGGFMFNVDVRYGLIGFDTPTQLALLFGVGFTGP